MSEVLVIPPWTFADRVRKVRRHAKLSQREFAKRLEVAESTLASWEAGRSEPRFGELANLSVRVQREFKVPATWFLGLEPAPWETEQAAERKINARRKSRGWGVAAWAPRGSNPQPTDYEYAGSALLQAA